MYRIVQITDLHIGREGERPREIDVRGNLERVLDAVRREHADSLVLSGDLSFHDGDRQVYRYVRSRIEALGLPYAVIAGNHDISTHLAEEFSLRDRLHDGELYYARNFESSPGSSATDLRAIFLDSAPGNMSDMQIEWLREEVASLNESGRPAIVFIHHPPLPCACRFMDSYYPFTRSADLVPLLESLVGLNAVYCGHYHAEALQPLPGRPEVSVHVTPSIWFQIDRESEQLAVSGTVPGYRVIDWDHSRVVSAVKYVETPR